jgi:hypothetical protein
MGADPQPQPEPQPTMTADPCFADTYSQARARFLAAAAAAGARIETIRHPLRGPDGGMLACDVARLGPPRARRALVTISGTHGVEGHCGSGAQTASLREGLYAALPEDTCVVAIHAINPHGFAWSRRVTEDNVDLNRNFVDHGAPYPVNAGYEELRAAICPPRWDDETRAAARRRLDAYAEAHGRMALQQAISGGQYSDPHGVFFGGHASTWSNRTLRQVFAALDAHAREIGVIDYHTGLGPYGHGELITSAHANPPAYARLCAWLGKDDITSPDLGNSSSAPLVGVNAAGMRGAAPHAQVSVVVLEFGVRPLDQTLDALRGDAWLHAHGTFGSPEWTAIKAEMRRVFYGDEPRWKEMIVARGFDVTRRMLAGLATA